MKIILSLFFFSLSNYSFSQFDKKIINGKFNKYPKFDSSCGILVSAEEIQINNSNDTLKLFTARVVVDIYYYLFEIIYFIQKS